MELNYIAKIIIIAIVAILGGILSYLGIRSDTYKNLQLSVYQPKSWIFSAVWIFIYVTYTYVWIKTSPDDPIFSLYNILFMINAGLNLAWSFFFFYLFEFRIAMIILVLLAVTIIIQIYLLYRRRIMESGLYIFLLLIYLSWLFVAGILNYHFI